MDNLFDFASQQGLFRKLEVSDVLFTEYKCMQQESVFGVWSHYNYVVYVLSGKKKWRTLSQDYMVYAEEAIFVKKGANIIHKFFEEEFCALIMFLPDHFIREVVASLPPPPAGPALPTDAVIPIHLNRTLSAYFHSLYAYFLEEQPPPAHLLEIKFKELIAHLVSFETNRPLCHYFRELCHQHKPSLREIMEANFKYNLTLAEFARLTGRSLTAFKREFQQQFQMSPGRWLTQARLHYARHLLETSDWPVNELVLECGFENTSHFSRIFKQHFGTSPLQYRKVHAS
ncbi:Helix-turn-helix domain-containing protein [Catalinimonas alkaloidigena]|uniref:Helix-turn-helix domain-containing protein n=1 Tax=Catalinimonas alkaloidigena TaxID=1075417 RepID=A0A1G9RPL0_9BACT|nr:AraC family transcriptional regulator [Catalinimonas alkaloidigena]SDM25122.1 Helix-turn-helix domain-containing protein [Catalinimonas alkaloidigena]